MKVLLASVTNKPPEILRPHLDSVLSQGVDAAYIVDPALPAESRELLVMRDVIVLDALPKPPDARYDVTELTHEWSKPTFYWLAREKQRLIDYARKFSYDAIWFVDSDLVCSPDTLASLKATERDVVSAVFWTRWTSDAHPLPQVWLAHPYELQGRDMEAYEFLQALRDRALVEVAGLGACTLIRSEVFDKVAFWPLVPDLPDWGMWQGEDRHFCVRASRNHVSLWADAWPDVFHVYRDSDIERIPDEWHAVTRAPRIGDLVSFTIEPVEEPRKLGYKEHVRGRMGSVRMLPHIEDALLEMTPGEERFVKVRFPLWWEIPEYRGTVKSVRLKLLGVKGGAPLAPTLATFENAPEFLFDPFYAA